MATRTVKAWASVDPSKDEVLVTIQYTGEGKINTLVNSALKAINQSAGVAVRHYRKAAFMEWGKTLWAHETGAPYNTVTATYKMSR